jgi:alpha-L-arabinofuranosidase
MSQILSRTAAACLLSMLALPAAASSPVNITIHADQPGATIDRHIYGQFAEHLGRGIYEGVWVGENSPIPNVRGFRTDVVAALRELHVPVVRWPGGCFADEYHWRDGIGPRANRPVTLNTNWGGVPDTNEFGTHEFMDFVEQIGADAYINGNLGTGSAREMAEWLQYMTSDKPTALTAERARNGHPGPWRVAYFAVGNEAWGCGGNMRAEHYVDEFRQVATYLKTPQGVRPVIIASGGNDNDTSWTEALISVAPAHPDEPRMMGAISFHYYTLSTDKWAHKGSAVGFEEAQWISTFAHTLRMEDYISHNSALMDRYDPAKKVGFAVDEWGTWYDPEQGREPGFLYQQNTLRDGLLAAVNLNVFHHHADRVRMTNIAQMVNVLQAMVLTQGPKMVLTPTYHVFRMFKPFQDATALPAEFQSPQYSLGEVSVPAVSLSAARTPSGHIAVALVNLDPHNAIPVSFTLAGSPARHETATHVTGEILTAPAMDAHNTFEAPEAIKPVVFRGATLKDGAVAATLPSKSVVVLLVE